MTGTIQDNGYLTFYDTSLVQCVEVCADIPTFGRKCQVFPDKRFSPYQLISKRQNYRTTDNHYILYEKSVKTDYNVGIIEFSVCPARAVVSSWKIQRTIFLQLRR
jgi:hypothetical protein